jgi:hypothetical protein
MSKSLENRLAEIADETEAGEEEDHQANPLRTSRSPVIIRIAKCWSG